MLKAIRHIMCLLGTHSGEIYYDQKYHAAYFKCKWCGMRDYGKLDTEIKCKRLEVNDSKFPWERADA